MKLLLFILVCLSINVGLFAQNDATPSNEKLADSSAVIDHSYREDQFYASITYNLVQNRPNGVSQSGFSGGFHFGFIRDMPINKRRNVAIGIGLGLSTNSYNQNILISEVNNTLNYQVLNNDIPYSKNKFTTYLIEMPVEFRWRTSTATTYDFWRIYSGIKFGYVVYNSSKFEGNPQNVKLSAIDQFNRLQYGLTISIGYSKFNAYCYYELNSIFNGDARINATGQNIDLNTLKIGLIFYIL